MGKVYDLVGDPQTVRVTVSGKRSVLARVRTSNISAIADLSQMEVSTYLVPITAEVKGLEGETVTTQVNPVNLQIKIEDMKSNTYPISASTTNLVPRDGFVVGEASVSPEKITIRGTESKINNIHRVVAKARDSADLSGLSEDTTLDAELIIFDGDRKSVV